MKTKKRTSLIIQAAASPSDIEFTGSVEIQAQAMEGDAPKGPRRFEMIAYSGSPMKFPDIEHPVVVDLKGMTITKKPRPILHNHSIERIVGHTEKIEVRDNSLVAVGLISGVNDVTREILASADNGFPFQASIGASLTGKPRFEFVPEGRKAHANGKTFEGPLLIARRSSLREISFVALGADDDTSARIAASAAEGTDMDFSKWLEAKGFTLDTLTENQRDTLQAAYDAEIKAAADAAAATVVGGNGDDKLNANGGVDLKARREAEAVEVERIAAIRKECGGKHDKIEAQAIREGWDLEKVQLEVLRAARPTSGPYINTGTGGELTVDCISAAMARSFGVSEEAAFDGLDDNSKEIAASSKLRGIGLHQAMYIIAQANGIQVSGRVDDEFIRAIFRVDQNQINADGGSAYSTISLSNIFENTMNKAMIDSYQGIPSTVSQIAYETDTNDFRAFKRYRMTGNGALTEVGPTGEIHNVGLQDSTYSNQLKTVAGLIGITRQHLINDDMGALTQMAAVLGKMARVSREKAVYTAILANTGNFFHSSNSNLMTGASSALSITSLSTAEQKLLEQTDDNDDFIGLMGQYLLVPPALAVTAENLFNGANLIAGALQLPAQVSGSSDAQSRSYDANRNPHFQKYRPIVSPYLGSASPLTGKSDSAWYLLPAGGPGGAIVQVAYLRGQRTPTIERGEMNFNTLGIAMRAYWDIGVALFDPRAGVKSNGV